MKNLIMISLSFFSLLHSAHAQGTCTPDANTFCAGEKVIFQKEARTIETIRSNGKIILQSTENHYRTRVNASDITQEVSSFSGLNEGETVLFGNQVREIKFLDDTGRVMLKETDLWDQKLVTGEQISKLVDSSNGFKVGDTVYYDKSNRVIQYLDVNGRAVLAEDDDHYQAFTDCTHFQLVVLPSTANH